MVEKLKLRKGKMPKAQKKRFLQYMIKILITTKVNVIDNFKLNVIDNLEDYIHYNRYAFCNLYRHYFGIDIRNSHTGHQIFTTIPEFLQYKPDSFYDAINQPTVRDSQFWFKLNLSGIEKRLEICKEILKQS